ncbi:MAG: hypothetical protein JRI35_01865 [Deltaproteobacteria bacterium]|nr:hypothetical protein [Deltaproteobacteria bacterium]
MNPLYPALKRFAFFRVSKLIRCPYQRQCNLARDRNPSKGKPLLRQGARMATVHGQGIFL